MKKRIVIILLFLLTVNLYGFSQTVEVKSKQTLSGWIFLLPDSSGSSVSADFGLDATIELDTNGVGYYTVKKQDQLYIKLYQREEDLSEFIKLPGIIISDKNKGNEIRYFAFYIPTEKERELPVYYWNKLAVRDKLYKQRIRKEKFLRNLNYKL